MSSALTSPPQEPQIISSNMSSNKKTIIAFDLYGTLLSTESIATELATHFGKEKAASIAALWRRYQLEYTWRLNSMSAYEPFSKVTLKSLHHALAEHKVSLDQSAIDTLMKAYDSLDTFPDVQPALEELGKRNDIECVVFSNGTDEMVGNSVKKSPSLGKHADVFKDLITVVEVERYKPDPKVYTHLAKKVGKDASQMSEMWLVSGNPFDVVGARATGMQAAWVSRQGSPWIDRLGEGPTVVVKGLGGVVKAVEEHAAKTESR
jgi:2-haloacid dehalogenase